MNLWFISTLSFYAFSYSAFSFYFSNTAVFLEVGDELIDQESIRKVSYGSSFLLQSNEAGFAHVRKMKR